nr:pirin family protein [Corynebacterium lactis]
MTNVEIITARDVPLGGPRAMPVHRTLPQKQRSTIGAWCFCDHYGPDDVSATGGMDVAPHPHTGLQTVSWLFEGEITHHDSAGNHAVVKPGEANFMTAGAGICHSEVSTQDTTMLHGVQLWVALPDNARDGERNFEHYTPEVTTFDGGQALVFIGSLFGASSPVTTFTPLVGAEVQLSPGATVEVEVNPAYEHGFLLDRGELVVGDTTVARTELAYTGINETTIMLHNPGDETNRFMVLGGEPFTEDLVMWWNFVGRTSDEIAQFRADWEAETERFGKVHGYVSHDPRGLIRLPAPTWPNITLRARRNPEPVARPDMRIDEPAATTQEKHTH